MWPSETTRANPTWRPSPRVEPDDAGGRRDELVDHVAIATGGPVRRREKRVDGRPVDPTAVVVEHESVRRASAPSRLSCPAAAASAPVPSGRGTGRDHALRGAAACCGGSARESDASRPSRGPTTSARSAGWRSRSALFAGMIAIARLPSALVAPAAGLLAAGILGNSFSAAWNGMEVPNPLVVGGDSERDRLQPRPTSLRSPASSARRRDRHLADPQPGPDSGPRRGARESRAGISTPLRVRTDDDTWTLP